MHCAHPKSGILETPRDPSIELVRALREEIRMLRADNARLRESQRQSLIDGTTGLCDRDYFDRRLRQEMSRADRFALPLSLVVVEIDDLRAIKEVVGQQEVDRVVRWVADRLSSSCRECDVACRISDNEFALLLMNTEFDGANVLVDRLAQLLRFGEGPTLGGGFRVEMSFGVSSYPEAETPLEMVFEAEGSMIEAKSVGPGPASERCIVAA